MSIQKFKNFEDATKALWIFNPDAGYYKKVSGLYKMFSRLSKLPVTPGVFKFKNLKEAQEHRNSEIKKFLHKVKN